MQKIKYDVDFCVVGGGISGICAAISAARRGLSVAIMQDRPMFGGNASSEVRMWICGAQGVNNRETGIVEELTLENMKNNPMRNYPLWDIVMYEKIAAEANIQMILNCACCKAEMNDSNIISVTGYQTTTQNWVKVKAKIFCDCSGDSVLAELTGALYRKGREASDEFNEDIAPSVSDLRTMGMSCLLQLRNTGRKSVFNPPARAFKYTKDNLPYRQPSKNLTNDNFWYLELGGMVDSIKDTENIRDELVRTALGMWDFVKNSGEYEADNWELDWIGILPGKRESLRYIGDYIMTQNDVRSNDQFEDLIAYGGWSMDDHHPGGFHYEGKPTIFHPAPSPYGIAYRCLYSKNIENLMFAGRNISVTHSALSSTRVMATCGLIGQAAGTGAAVAVKNKVSPRGVYTDKTLLADLQQKLMDDDCFLPYLKRNISLLTASAVLDEKYSPLRNGYDRPTPTDSDKKVFNDNGVIVAVGEKITFKYNAPQTIKGVRFTFDSDLNRTTVKPTNQENVISAALNHNMMSNRTINFDGIEFVETIVTDVEIIVEKNNSEIVVFKLSNNNLRYAKIEFGKAVENAVSVTIVPLKTSGKDDKFINNAHIYSIDIL